jgi:type I restriction enzyme S subunit
MNLFLLRTDVAHLDQTFAYFWLKANEPYVKSFACGAATATITKNAVRELVIPLPPLSVQRKIATILSSYDDLIENNRRRINILEEMAQNFYCEWFVKLHFPGHEKAIFLDSHLCRIPKGWEIKELCDFIDFERGVEPGSKNYVKKSGDDYVPFLRVGDLGKRESVLFIKKSLAKGRMLKANDIAVTMDGTVGLVRMGLEGAYSSGIRRIAPHADCPIGKAFIFQLLKSEHIQAIIEAHAKGTTIKHAGSSIGHMVFMLPEKIVADAFEEYVTPLLDSVLSLQRRDDVLRRTRDLLLPKLISGEVDVSELDITIPKEVAA